MIKVNLNKELQETINTIEESHNRVREQLKKWDAIEYELMLLALYDANMSTINQAISNYLHKHNVQSMLNR